jgi:hypothetical protein
VRTSILVAVLLAGAVLASGVTHADEGDTDADADAIPELDQLRAPDSAAFALLGVSPTEIQRPTTPTALGLALGSFVSGGSVAVPDSLAVEVAPYWLFSHPELTGDQMAESTPSEAMVRNFTVSIGTTTRTIEVVDGMGGAMDASVTDMAVGLRTRWLDGRKRVTCWDAVEAAAAGIAEQQGKIISLELGAILARHQERPIPSGASAAERDKIVAENDASSRAREAEIERVHARAREQSAAAHDALRATAQKCVLASAARTGLLGDAALGASWRFPDAQFGDGEWLAGGGWLTLAAQGKSHSLVALARLLADGAGDDTSLIADTGARYIHVRSRHALSAELVYRYLSADVEDQHLLRVALAVDVRVVGATWFTATFGRDFAAPDAGEVFALASIKWGFGGPTVKLPGR